MTIEMAIKESDPDWGSLTSFLRSAGHGGASAHVAARDEMYVHGLNYCPVRSVARFGYLRAGLQSHLTLKQILDWKFAGDGSRKSFLDFASGYGRATRFMRRDFPQFDMMASDILPGAMEFQGEYLGVETMLSTTRPEDFAPGRKFDFIWVASLFTHLPRHRSSNGCGGFTIC